jgi:hypothetical protein
VSDLLRAVHSTQDFRDWLDFSGRGYLQDGVGHMDIGDALMEIYRRAGVRGISKTDSVVDTLPMAREIIAIRCKPRRK